MSIQLKYFASAILLLMATMMAILQPASSVLADPTGEVQPPIEEQEPNDTADQAQELSSIGAANYVNAQINQGGDVDWYKFTGQAGKTYVIELFEVHFDQNNQEGNSCLGGGNIRRGLALIVQDQLFKEIKKECEPNGVGNVQSIVDFQAEINNATYYIKLFHNNSEYTGSYKIRVLPKYDDENAQVGWDDTTHEPNNTLDQAYEIGLGRMEALNPIIEVRNGNYITNNSDVDWYRFNTQANKTYVIELFNVDFSLDSEGNNCLGGGNTRKGLALVVYNSSSNIIEGGRRCEPNGPGNVQSIVKFRAGGQNATYHIKVFPNSAGVTGSYHIRVLKEYNNKIKNKWYKSNFKSNNLESHSYPIELGQDKASQIEPSSNDYVRSGEPDEDWYHFSAAGGQTYKIELFNVNNDMAIASGNNCLGGGNTRAGPAL